MFTRNNIFLIKNNREIKVDKAEDLPTGLQIKISGENNTVKIDQDCIFQNTVIYGLNNNAFLSIGRGCRLHNMLISINSGMDQRLEIGALTTFFGGKIFLRDKSHVKIGQECLFAEGIVIWTTDGHTIFDLNTKQVLNETPDILEIGNHCWIGGDVRILKKGSLANDTVVGMCSVVTKRFTEPNVVIGGYPAKILRRGISWNRATIPDWKKKQ